MWIFRPPGAFAPWACPAGCEPRWDDTIGILPQTGKAPARSFHARRTRGRSRLLRLSLGGQLTDNFAFAVAVFFSLEPVVNCGQIYVRRNEGRNFLDQLLQGNASLVHFARRQVQPSQFVARVEIARPLFQTVLVPGTRLLRMQIAGSEHAELEC